MVNIPVWKIMPSCGVVIVKVTQRNYQNGFDVVFRLFGRWTLWRLFSDVFLSRTQKYFLKVMSQKANTRLQTFGPCVLRKEGWHLHTRGRHERILCLLLRRVSPACLLWCVLSDHIPLTAVYPFTLQEIVLNLWRKANSHKLVLIWLWLT